MTWINNHAITQRVKLRLNGLVECFGVAAIVAIANARIEQRVAGEYGAGLTGSCYQKNKGARMYDPVYP